MEDKLKNLDKENIIWLIYIFIFVMAIVSNYYEEKNGSKEYNLKEIPKNNLYIKRCKQCVFETKKGDMALHIPPFYV